MPRSITIFEDIHSRFHLPRTFLFLGFCLFFMVGIILAYPSLSYYWFNDDLFLVKPYSNEELVHAFAGDWDPSGISTPGYRPLTVMFYHVTAIAFGENLVLHRVFRIALFALQLAFLGLIAVKLGLTRWQALLAGVLVLCTKNTWWVLVWPTDGIRAFATLLAELAAYLFLKDLENPTKLKFLGAILLFTGALLSREDVLVFVPLIPLFGLFQLVQPTWFHFSKLPTLLRSTPLLRRIILQALSLALVFVVYWWLRAHLVPNTSAPLSLAGWFYSLLWVFWPRLALLSIPVWIGVLIAFWALLILIIRLMPPHECRLAFFWLVCTVLSAATGLVVTRANTLLPALCFFGLFLATVFGGVIKAHRVIKLVAGMALSVFVISSALQHRTVQQSLAPNSTQYLYETSRYFWGEWAAAYDFIPQNRRDYLRAQFAALHIGTKEQYLSEVPKLIRDGTLFNPADDWLSGW